MVLHQAVFYIFSSILTLSALMVVTARNPVHSVLYLILAFFNAAGLFVLMGAELLAMTLVIVYVGAVAVLFLFVVMMFDVHAGSFTQTLKRYKLFSFCMGLVLLAELIFLFFDWQSYAFAQDLVSNPLHGVGTAKTNAHALGNILYTHYVYLFELAGLILLVAIIGAITLTLRHTDTQRRQDIEKQLNRDPKAALKLVKVESKRGIEI